MREFIIYAQLEPIAKNKGPNRVEFIPNIVKVKTIQAESSEQAFRIAKTIVPHPLVERQLTEREQRQLEYQELVEGFQDAR